MARIGLVGGSGLDHWGETARALAPGDRPFGAPSADPGVFTVAGHELLFLPRHGKDHAIAPQRVNYRANIHALREAGATAVLAVNAVGSLDRSLGPGALAVPDQLIDYTWGREGSFHDGKSGLLDHVEFAEPFSDAWRRRLFEAGEAAGVRLRPGGCLGVTQGPRLETAAEIHRLGRDGCRLVGMTSLPEAALAREAGLGYACLAAVANFAAGVSNEPITLEAIEATLTDAMRDVRAVVQALLEHL